MDKGLKLMVLSMKRDVFMDERIAQKRDTPERMSLQYAHYNKALQRRVIRVRVHTTHSVGHSLRSECQRLSHRALKPCKPLLYIRIITPS